MSADAYRFYHDAIEARRDAHFVMRSRLPGWRIYAAAKLARAISKWKQYKDARAGK